MRKLHKQQLLELIETLKSACYQLETQNEEVFINLCAEIQNFVSEIFEYVENILDENSLAAKYLKDIYEMLYHVSQKTISTDKVLKKIKKLEVFLNKLEPSKIEIVFLCYKASMADSLESIYFAAREDKNCDAYFIPIPYFEKNADGSFGEMHLEGREHYPKEYELTDWQSYNIENRRPDVIFIMNPYDGGNRVTSVHPYFYSSRLKNYTDALVYIEYGLPYWLYRDPFAPEVEAEFKKDGIILPAHIHAHYCITYAKELAKGYFPLFSTHPEIVQKWDMTPQKIEEKFIPLGSSKFDKIINYDREDYELPEDWGKKIHGKK